MTGCWSGKVVGYCLNILFFMLFIFIFNIIFVMRTDVVSTKRYCRLSTIHNSHASCTLSLHFAQHRTALLTRVYQPRYRRDCLGELVQIDGSHHDWFEGRAPKCCLLVFMDDATGRLKHLRSRDSENAFDYIMDDGYPTIH